MPSRMETLFDEIRRYVGFTDEDARSLAAFRPLVVPYLPGIAEEFYRKIEQHPNAHRVFADREQVERLKRTMCQWAERLFAGPHDEDYFQLRSVIGRVHVRIGLEQIYMVTGMTVLRRALRSVAVKELASDPARLDHLLQALHKVLDIDLAIMLESYREDSIARLWQSEQQAALKRLAAIGEMAASVAHEVRNPLAGISGAMEVLRDDLPPDSPRRDVIREVLLQIRRLDIRVRELLMYSRSTMPVMARVSPAGMVASTLSLLSEEPMLREVRTHVTVQPDVGEHTMDQGQMQEVLVNLIRNAADAMQGRGDLYIEVRRVQGSLHVAVEDTGPGVPAARAEEIFAPFMTTRPQGTGLGLSISRKNVEAHGGTLVCQPGVHGGARFVAVLPALPPKSVLEDQTWPNAS
jgi:two-component system, NtrC family, sensor histidine kinase HydH